MCDKRSCLRRILVCPDCNTKTSELRLIPKIFADQYVVRRYKLNSMDQMYYPFVLGISHSDIDDVFLIFDHILRHSVDIIVCRVLQSNYVFLVNRVLN